MKYKEMEKICQQNNGKCKDCKLNCIYDWYDTINKTIREVWCLKAVRKRYENKYMMLSDRGASQEELEAVIKEYTSIEQKYLYSKGDK